MSFPKVKFGIVLPSFVYNQYREGLVTQTFRSIQNTVKPTEKAVLFLVIKKSQIEFDYQLKKLAEVEAFDVHVHDEPTHIGSTEQSLAYGSTTVFDTFPEVTHVIWMGDDALFSPRWLIELEGLIGRHLDSKAWSVYRSAHVKYHAPLNEKDGDIQVKSLCGHGMTFSREEWKAWGINYEDGKQWYTPTGGSTLDLNHPYARPGERWCTGRSFVQHTGEVGINCRKGIPEYALNFAGEDQ